MRTNYSSTAPAIERSRVAAAPPRGTALGGWDARGHSFRRGGRYGWKPSSSSNFSIRAFRAYPLIEIRQTVPHRAIRGNSISVNSSLPPSYSLRGMRRHRRSALSRTPVVLVVHSLVWHFSSALNGRPTKHQQHQRYCLGSD